MFVHMLSISARILSTTTLQRETFIPAHALKAAGYKGNKWIGEKHL
jgi:hypothetical protein